MSLKIDSSKIYIQNSSGVTKFDSSNGLLYRAAYLSGSQTFSGATNYNISPHGLSYNPKTDIIVGSYKITACSGNLASGFLNLQLPSSVPICLHVENVAAVRSYGQLDSRPNILSMMVDTTNIMLQFRKIGSRSPITNANFGAPTLNPDVSVSFTWQISLYKRTY
jgi:hypothetical protein